MRCAFFVDLYGAVFPTALVAHTNVHVPDGCPVWSTALRCFLCEPFHGFGGEIPRVELRDRRHDAVQQHARRCLINVFARRDKHDSGITQGEMNGDVVGAVAGESVDFVHDAVIDLVLSDVLDHADQLGPVCLACGLARINELLDHCRTELFRFATILFTLGRDRVALLGATLLRLLFRRHAQAADSDCSTRRQ